MPDDYYVSQYSGEEIDERLTAAHNAVRYDAAQSLTDEQKTQARANIAAAPDGYGLGGIAKVLTAADDLNNITTTGWYCYHSKNQPANVPTPALYSAVMEVIHGYYSNQTAQRVYSTGDDRDWNLVLQRVFYGSAGWQPWEWVSPPMQLGVEYRTTERYGGTPVYVKLVDCGVMANNKNVSLVTASYRVIDVILKGNPSLFPMVPEGTSLSGWQGGFYCDGQSITLYAGQNLAESNHPAVAIVKFIAV